MVEFCGGGSVVLSSSGSVANDGGFGLLVVGEKGDMYPRSRSYVVRAL